ncbi:cyclic nucleotide-binding domain-containing protein [candidate division KSB1 bacterium]
MSENEQAELEIPQTIDSATMRDVYLEENNIRVYKTLRLIIKDGDSVDGLYLLVNGTIGFYKNGRYLGQQSHKNATFFGEMGVILGENRRNADVVSLTDCSVRVVPGDLKEIVQHRADIAMNLMISNTKRILDLNKLIAEVRQENDALKEHRLHLADIADDLRRNYKKAEELSYGDTRFTILKRIIEQVEGGKRPSSMKGFDERYFISGLMDLLTRSK